ncbi:MarR family winged helix-turn-helix transcriptional regulator, partial [Mammaliicoccus sciuri]
MDIPPINKQLGFMLYVASKELIKKYTPILKKYNLTYTGYIVLVAIDKNEVINIKTLGDRLYLDSGTLTPLLKKLEEKGFVNRERAINDERNLRVSLTELGIETQGQILEDIYQTFQDLNMDT